MTVIFKTVNSKGVATVGVKVPSFFRSDEHMQDCEKSVPGFSKVYNPTKNFINLCIGGEIRTKL
jgi:hypothetical protein